MPRRRRLIRTLIWALAIGLVVYAAATVVGPEIGVGAKGTPPVQVLVAARDIDTLQPITPGLVQPETVSLDTFRALGPRPVTAGDRGLLAGAVAQQHIGAGQPLLVGMLAGPKIGPGASLASLPASYGLYAIQAPYLSGPTSGLAPGAWVDVTATYRYKRDTTAVGPGGIVTATLDAADSPYVATTVETKVQVTDVRGAPQPAVTIAIPRADARVFDWYKQIDASFSFLEVSPTARHAPRGSLSYSTIKDRFDVPGRTSTPRR